MKTKKFTELEVNIFEAAIEIFNKKGLKLTMDDIASNMSISKKTIYTVFEGKEELFSDMVDYIFQGIKSQEEEVLNEEGLTTLERIRKLLAAMPERYSTINWQEIPPIKEKFPKVYRKMQKRIETGWEQTLQLMEKGKEEGVIKKDADLRIFKLMMEASIERFFEDNVLKKNKISYVDALNSVVDILLEGVKA